MKRRISHSPVSVNTTYELSEKNTEKLWENFKRRTNSRGSSKGSYNNLEAKRERIVNSITPIANLNHDNAQPRS